MKSKTEEIWREYQQKLARFIKSKVSEDVADDILQDVFLKIHTRIDTLKTKDKLESWLYQITRNTILDHYRSKRTTEELPDWLEQPQEEDNTTRQALATCLEPMIKALPKTYQSSIRLSEIENKTQKEVAEKEGLTLSGAKSRIQRGRVLLKGILHECCTIDINQENQVTDFKKKNNKCDYC